MKTQASLHGSEVIVDAAADSELKKDPTQTMHTVCVIYLTSPLRILSIVNGLVNYV